MADKATDEKMRHLTIAYVCHANTWTKPRKFYRIFAPHSISFPGSAIKHRLPKHNRPCARSTDKKMDAGRARIAKCDSKTQIVGHLPMTCFWLAVLGCSCSGACSGSAMVLRAGGKMLSLRYHSLMLASLLPLQLLETSLDVRLVLHAIADV